MRHLKFILIALSCMFFCHGYAQPDPTRAATIGIVTKTSVKSIAAEDAIIATQISGHILLNKEVNQITDFKKQFNDYLSSFQNTLAYAANLYGIYLEVDRAIKNVKNLTSVTVKCPDNTLAVVFSRKKNKVYKNVVETGMKVVSNIATITPFYTKDKEKNPKMTEQERLQCIEDIRMNLRQMNYQMSCMYRYIKYTTLMDSWYELTQKEPLHQTRPMKDIVSDCRSRWANNAKKVNSFNCK